MPTWIRTLAATLLIGAAVPARADITVYAALGYDQAVVDAFTRATGIPVRLVHLSTGPLLARVQAEGARPQWDVLWFDGELAMRAFADRRMLRCDAGAGVTYTGAGRALMPADHCYAPVTATYAATMLVDASQLPPAAWPRSWDDLAAPRLRGRVGMNNPAISGPTFPFVAGMLQQRGDAGGEAYFTALKHNGLRVYPTNSVTLRALQYHQIAVAVVQSSAALGFARSRPNLRIVAPAPCTSLASDIAIGAQVQGKARDEARKFEAFVLSPAGQHALLAGDADADSNAQPLIAGVVPPASLAALHPATVQHLDPARWGVRESSVDAWFTDHVVH